MEIPIINLGDLCVIMDVEWFSVFNGDTALGELNDNLLMDWVSGHHRPYVWVNSESTDIIVVNFLQTTQQSHPIAFVLGWDMGCLFLDKILIHILLPSLQCKI